MPAATAKNEVLDAIARRQTVRRFAPSELAYDKVIALLEYASRAPSGFNLQPWRYIVVQDPVLKRHLCHVALNQQQITEAPATVIFVADPDAWRSSYDRVLKLSLDCGAIDPQRAKRYRRLVNLHFQLAPLGLFGFLKKLALPFLRLRAPTPDVLTSQSDVDHYVMSHTMLAASTFMIAASGVGLGTCPMEGFDEFRLKKLLKIPRQMRVPIIVAIGYPLEGHATPRTPRIPIQERVSIDYYARRPVGKKTS